MTLSPSAACWIQNQWEQNPASFRRWAKSGCNVSFLYPQIPDWHWITKMGDWVLWAGQKKPNQVFQNVLATQKQVEKN